MNREPGTVWRKKRGGREYGSFYTYAEGHIVNLATTALDEARLKARQLVGAVASVATPIPAAPRDPGATAPSSPRPTFLRDWAAGGGAAAPLPGPAAPAPPSPVLSPAMEGLAEGLASAVTRLNVVAVRLGVRYLADRKPPNADEDEIAALEKTWAAGLKELMLTQGMQWWHILLVQNGALGLRLVTEGEPLPPRTLSPVNVGQQA